MHACSASRCEAAWLELLDGPNGQDAYELVRILDGSKTYSQDFDPKAESCSTATGRPPCIGCAGDGRCSAAVLSQPDAAGCGHLPAVRVGI